MACDSREEAPPSSSAQSPTNTTRAATPTPTTPVRATRRVTLDVAWRADGARWPTVLSIEFGGAVDELGIKTYPDRAPIIPSSFAVTDEGYWILDPQKGRLCLFDFQGRLRKTWRGVQQVASDLALDEDRRPIIIDREPDGAMLRLSGSRLRPFDLGRPAYRLAQTDAGAYDVILELAGRGPGRQRYLTMDGTEVGSLPAGSEQLTISTGDVEGTRTTFATRKWRTRITFPARSRVDAASFVQDATLNADKAYLPVVPGTFETGGDRENPLYLLVMSLRSGRVLEFERVEQGAVDDTNQATNFAIHNGAVFQLWLSDGHLEIRRRPASG